MALNGSNHLGDFNPNRFKKNRDRICHGTEEVPKPGRAGRLRPVRHPRCAHFRTPPTTLTLACIRSPTHLPFPLPHPAPPAHLLTHCAQTNPPTHPHVFATISLNPRCRLLTVPLHRVVGVRRRQRHEQLLPALVLAIDGGACGALKGQQPKR